MNRVEVKLEFLHQFSKFFYRDFFVWKFRMSTFRCTNNLKNDDGGWNTYLTLFTHIYIRGWSGWLHFESERSLWPMGGRGFLRRPFEKRLYFPMVYQLRLPWPATPIPRLNYRSQGREGLWLKRSQWPFDFEMQPSRPAPKVFTEHSCINTRLRNT